MTDIQIYSSSATPLILAPITSSSRYEQELMKTDRIHLEWDAVDNLPIPLGSYVMYQGTRYYLTKPYHPESKDMGRYSYKVDFEHVLMTLAKIPFLLHTPLEDGTTQVECDWNYTGDVETLARELKKSLNSALNTSYNIIVDESIKTAVSLSFSNKDILSALNEICSNIECEWWYEGSTIKIAPKCINEGGGSSVLSLVAGEHVDYPSSNDKAEFFNRFYVFGGTRNIPQDYQGAQASTIINKRLTLDKTIHQSGYLDLPYFDINGDITISNTPREGFAPFYTEEGEVKYYKLDPSVIGSGSTFTKVLQLDDIYPRAELKVAHIARREKYVRDDADKPVETASGFSTYFVYYVQFTTKDGSIFHFNPKTYTKGQGGDVIKNQKPSIHFNSGSLTGREFEIYNHYTQIPQIKNETGDKSNVDFSGFVEVQGEASIFEIAFKEDGTIIIPNIGIAPQVDDEAVVFGIRMPEQYVHNAYIDLDQKAIEQIYELSKDGNEYSVKSNQVYFAESNPNLTLGRHVHLNLGDRVIDTRVIKLTTKLDRPYEQEIAFCKAISKGSIQTILTTIENTQQQVIETQLIDDENVRRARQRMSEANEELRNSIFDTDGYFKDGNIKPETIETLMLSVGAKSTDYMLEGVVFAPNNDGTTTANPNAVNIIQGTTAKLTHFGISEGEAKEWTLAKPASAYTTDEEGKAFADAQVYYLYARCASNGTSGTFVFSKEKYKYNQFVDTNRVYYFLVGILSSVIDGSRILNMTYGSTTINGEQIKTGVIKSNNGRMQIDLNNATITTDANGLKIGSSSVDQYISNEAKSAVGQIQLGGRNYIRKSDESVTGTGQIWFRNAYIPANSIAVSESIVFTIQITSPSDISSGVSVVLWADGGTYQVFNINNVTTGTKRYLVRQGTIYNGLCNDRVRIDCRGNGLTFAKPKMEKGTNATDWTPAPEDDSDAISTANTNASLAKASADATSTALSNVDNDGIFSTIEKRAMQPQWRVISGVADTTSTPTANGTYQTTLTNATGAGISTSNSLYTALTSAFSNLKTYLNAVGLYYNTNFTFTSTYTRALLSQRFNEYHKAETALSDYIAKYYTDALEFGTRNLLLKSRGKFNWAIPTSGFQQVDMKTSTSFPSVTNDIVIGFSYKVDNWTNGYSPINSVCLGQKSGGDSWSARIYPSSYKQIDSTTRLYYGFYTAKNGDKNILGLNGGIKIINERGGLSTAVGFQPYQLMLVQGNKIGDWTPAPEDNDGDSQFDRVAFLTNTFEDAKNGETNIIGGLVLTDVIATKDKDGKVTTQISGNDEDPNSIAIACGNDLHNEEPNFSVTHSGHAEMRDVEISSGALASAFIQLINGNINLGYNNIVNTIIDGASGGDIDSMLTKCNTGGMSATISPSYTNTWENNYNIGSITAYRKQVSTADKGSLSVLQVRVRLKVSVQGPCTPSCTYQVKCGGTSLATGTLSNTTQGGSVSQDITIPAKTISLSGSTAFYEVILSPRASNLVIGNNFSVSVELTTLTSGTASFAKQSYNNHFYNDGVLMSRASDHYLGINGQTANKSLLRGVLGKVGFEIGTDALKSLTPSGNWVAIPRLLLNTTITLGTRPSTQDHVQNLGSIPSTATYSSSSNLITLSFGGSLPTYYPIILFNNASYGVGYTGTIVSVSATECTFYVQRNGSVTTNGTINISIYG